MSSRSDRAKRRRREWTGEVVENGEAKEPLYSGLTHSERLVALARLNERVWGLADLPTLHRSNWPGEVFEF